MRKVFAGLAGLLMLVIVVQFFLAGSGAFSSEPTEEAFRPHRALGYVIVLLAILLTLIGAFSGLPGRVIGMSGLVIGLAILQPIIAIVANALSDEGDTSTVSQLVFGLHAVNALVIMGVLRQVMLQARELSAPAKTPADTTSSPS